MCIIICNASLNDVVEGIAYKPHIFSLSGEYYFENYSWKTQHYVQILYWFNIKKDDIKQLSRN